MMSISFVAISREVIVEKGLFSEKKRLSPSDLHRRLCVLIMRSFGERKAE